MKNLELESLFCRKNKLLTNGKNTESSGVIRKINRKIRKCSEK